MDSDTSDTGMEMDGAPTEDPLMHAQWAARQPLPKLFHPSPLTPNQLHLLRRMTEEPSVLKQEVTAKLQYWTARKQALTTANVGLKQNLPADKQSTLGCLGLFLLEEMLYATAHSDKSFVEDLAAGFAVTGAIENGPLGEPIPGGTRANRKPGMGGPPDMASLRSECRAINESTLRKARSRLQEEAFNPELAQEAWAKFQKYIDVGYADAPVELDQINLDEVLLVDSFPVLEQHAGMQPKVWVINNYKSNRVNSFAWAPNRLRYNGFDDLKQATRVLKESWQGELLLAKADFKSAFKTVPPQFHASVALVGAGVQSSGGEAASCTPQYADIWERGGCRGMVSHSPCDTVYYGGVGVGDFYVCG